MVFSFYVELEIICGVSFKLWGDQLNVVFDTFVNGSIESFDFMMDYIPDCEEWMMRAFLNGRGLKSDYDEPYEPVGFRGSDYSRYHNDEE